MQEMKGMKYAHLTMAFVLVMLVSALLYSILWQPLYLCLLLLCGFGAVGAWITVNTWVVVREVSRNDAKK